MTDVAPATPAAPEPIAQSDIAVHTPGGEGELTPRDAARSLVDWRRKRAAGEKPDPDKFSPSEFNQERKAPAEGEQELAPANAGPEEVPSETQAPDPADELPSIEPPRSWKTEEKERFKSFPRELQAYLSEREQERERDFLRRTNEAAEDRKAAQAEREAGSQAKQQYEQALPVLLQTLYQQQAGEFQDIQSMADVERLAREDFPRYAVWDAQQKKIAAVQGQLAETQQRQSQEAFQRWNDFTKSEDAKFAEKVPDIADSAKGAKLREAAVSVLKEHGFKEEEIGASWNGQAPLSLRDHRLQLLIHDAIKYREAKAAAKRAEAKPVPPVQRPGVAPPKGQADADKLQALKQKLERTGNVKDAARLLAARRASVRA